MLIMREGRATLKMNDTTPVGDDGAADPLARHPHVGDLRGHADHEGEVDEVPVAGRLVGPGERHAPARSAFSPPFERLSDGFVDMDVARHADMHESRIQVTEASRFYPPSHSWDSTLRVGWMSGQSISRRRSSLCLDAHGDR